jgi:copper transport protein
METALTLSRIGLFGSVIVLVGGLLFLALLWPQGYQSNQMHRLLRWSLLGALISTLVSLLLYGPVSFGTPLSSAFSAETIEGTLSIRFGIVGIFRLIVLSLLAVVIGRWLDGPLLQFRAVASAVATVFLIGSLSLTGHAHTAGSLAIAADMVHLLAASVWLGGIVVLLFAVLPFGRTEELDEVVPSFSTIAFGCIVALAVTGVYHGLVQMGGVQYLTTSGYGILLCAKLVAFGTILGLGAVSRNLTNKRYVTNFAGSPEESWREPEKETYFRLQLRRTVVIEVIVGVLILGVTALLVNTSPPSHSSYTELGSETRIVSSTSL